LRSKQLNRFIQNVNSTPITLNLTSVLVFYKQLPKLNLVKSGINIFNCSKKILFPINNNYFKTYKYLQLNKADSPLLLLLNTNNKIYFNQLYPVKQRKLSLIQYNNLTKLSNINYNILISIRKIITLLILYFIIESFNTVFSKS
jgi:hypothetical protein